MTFTEEKDGEPRDVQVSHIDVVPKNLTDVEKDNELIDMEDGEVTFKTKLAIFVRVLFVIRFEQH